MYNVLLWNSKPGTNDDCVTGHEFDNRKDALNAYNNLLACPPGMMREISIAQAQGSELWIEVDGDDLHLERCIQRETEAHRRREARGCSEAAMLAGMAFGCEGYNDAMGY